MDGPNAGRRLDGILVRERIAIKRRLGITCRPLTAAEASIVLTLIEPEWVVVTYTDPATNSAITRVMYSNNIPALLIAAGQGENDLLLDKDGKILLSRYGQRAPLPNARAAVIYYFNDTLIGKYYFDGMRQVGVHECALTSYSAIYTLAQTDHPGGFYNGKVFDDVVADIIGSVVHYTIDDDIKTIPVFGYLPYQSRRDNLQLFLMATGIHIRNAPDGKLMFGGAPEELAGVFDTDRVFIGGYAIDNVPVQTKQGVQVVLGNEDY